MTDVAAPLGLHAAEDEGVRHQAYLSFAHKDKAVGAWVARMLRSFRTPRGLVRDFAAPARLGAICVDRQDSSAGAQLSDHAKAELRASAALIVICSPRAAASRWINQEVAAFKQLGRGANIIPVIAEGQAPGVLPLTLRYSLDAEGAPTDTLDDTTRVVADLVHDSAGRTGAMRAVAAALLGFSPAEMERYDAGLSGWDAGRVFDAARAHMFGAATRRRS